MFKYEIKKNYYPIGIAKGKKQAVERLKDYLAWEGITEDNQEWLVTASGNIHVKCNRNNFNLFSIEKSN